MIYYTNLSKNVPKKIPIKRTKVLYLHRTFTSCYVIKPFHIYPIQNPRKSKPSFFLKSKLTQREWINEPLSKYSKRHSKRRAKKRAYPQWRLMDPIYAANELAFRVGFSGHSGHLRLEPLTTPERHNPLRSIPDYIPVSLGLLHFLISRFFCCSMLRVTITTTSMVFS